MPRDLLEPDDRGLFCELGKFHIDPWASVPAAVITHAHGDHARGGSGLYYCASEGREILAKRLPPGSNIVAVPYGEKFLLGDVAVSFHPAGHIRGSSQVRVESGERVWVASGDYKRQHDPTCSPFELVTCDVFITEATFGLPIYRWEPADQVAAEIARWWGENAAEGKASVLFCYALGKAQRLLAELHSLRTRDEFSWIGEKTAYLHGAAAPLTKTYREAGVDMLATAGVIEEDDVKGKRPKRRPAEFVGELALAPPSAAGSPWMRRFGKDFQTGFASGWMRVRGVRKRAGYDRGFVLSDHVDWADLMRTVQETGAKRVLVTHGNTEVVARYLREQGLDSQTLRSRYAGDAGSDAP